MPIPRFLIMEKKTRFSYNKPVSKENESMMSLKTRRERENDEENIIGKKKNSRINIITSTFFVLFNVTWSDYVCSSSERAHTLDDTVTHGYTQT